MIQPFYISRELLNAEELVLHAELMVLENILPAHKMHVTQAFSRAPVDTSKIILRDDVLLYTNPVTISTDFEMGAFAIIFEADELKERWDELIAIGASWDFPQYHSHVSLSYKTPWPDRALPYEGDFLLGPEKLEPLDLNWAETLGEDNVSS